VIFLVSGTGIAFLVLLFNPYWSFKAFKGRLLQQTTIRQRNFFLKKKTFRSDIEATMTNRFSFLIIMRHRRFVQDYRRLNSIYSPHFGLDFLKMGGVWCFYTQWVKRWTFARRDVRSRHNLLLCTCSTFTLAFLLILSMRRYNGTYRTLVGRITDTG
jgi:hypothetical protein